MSPLLLLLLVVVGLLSSSSTVGAVEGIITGQCQPQGLLRLDKPYPSPRRVELPFCQQYGCSCCNASHALALQRAARVVAEDEDLSNDCKLGLLRLACRICDPEVGVGAKTHICSDTCKNLYDACAQDFFSYESGNGLISPCADESSGMLVCSQLSDLVSSAAEFCRAAGFGRMAAAESGPGELCFNGSPVSADACPANPPPAQQKQQRQSQKARQRRSSSSKSSSGSDLVSRLIARLPWRLKRRHKRQLAVAAELLIGTAVSGLMAWAVVLLLQRFMQPTRRRSGRPGGPPPANVREMLAKAAEERSRKGSGQKRQ